MIPPRGDLSTVDKMVGGKGAPADDEIKADTENTNVLIDIVKGTAVELIEGSSMGKYFSIIVGQMDKILLY